MLWAMRLFSFKRWRARELLVSWLVYWLVLAVVGLGPAAIAIWRATHGPANGTSNINLSVGSGGISLVVTANGPTIYSASIHTIVLALFVAGPPLLAWVAWAATRRRGEEVREVV